MTEVAVITGDGDRANEAETDAWRAPVALWRGASSPNAYVASHVPRIVFSAVFLFFAGSTTIAKLLRQDFAINPIAAVFTAIGIALIVHEVRAMLRDRDVSWEINARGVMRRSGRRRNTTPLTDLVSVELIEREGGRGDLIVRMPERRDAEGAAIYPSVHMLDVPDVRGAADAIHQAAATVRNAIKEITQ